MAEDANALRQLAKDAIKDASSLLVITGAGISAESGVPTFRGDGEHWRGKHFSELACPEAFAADPREIWDWYLYRRNVVAACKPNAAHAALAEWAIYTPGVTLVTQNVDGLHEDAGHPDVIRFHGSLWRNRCTECGTEREERSLAYEELPRSPCCNAPERPAIVWFGESIPRVIIQKTGVATVSASTVLVIGTSGVVAPAASFISLARRNGAFVIDVNPEETAINANIAIREPAATIVPLLLS